MRRLVLFIFVVFLCSCTSQRGQFEELAIKLAEKERTALLLKEADGSLKHSSLLHEGYVKAMSLKSEIKIKEIDMSIEGQASAQVYIELPSIVVRQALLGIASRVDTTRSRRFNYSEAVGLLRKELGLKPDNFKEQILKVYYFKKGSDGWTLLKGEN